MAASSSFRVGAANALSAEGFRELDEIRQRLRIAVRIAPAVQQFLPLTHHAHIFIVQDEDFHRQQILDRRRHFLNVHEDRRFASDVHDERVRMRELRADRRRQAVTHGAETTGGHPAIGLLEVIMLRGPHLMLADFRGDIDVAMLGQRIEPLNRILRFDVVSEAR